MVWDQGLPGVGCGLPWASSLRASPDNRSGLSDNSLVHFGRFGRCFGPRLCALFVRQPDNTITSR